MNDRVIQPNEQTDALPDDAAKPFVDRRVNTVDRRKTTVRSILIGAFNPRRRAGRRASDQAFPIDWHDRSLMVLALLMLALSVSDAFLTVTLLSRGAVEANVLLNFVINEHPRLFAVVKMGLTGCGIVVLVALTRSRLFGLISGKTLFQILVLAYLALVGYELWLLSTMP